jgi:hypothetical protein
MLEVVLMIVSMTGLFIADSPQGICAPIGLARSGHWAPTLRSAFA